jgi:hypothetical protein
MLGAEVTRSPISHGSPGFDVLRVSRGKWHLDHRKNSVTSHSLHERHHGLLGTRRIVAPRAWVHSDLGIIRKLDADCSWQHSRLDRWDAWTLREPDSWETKDSRNQGHSVAGRTLAPWFQSRLVLGVDLRPRNQGAQHGDLCKVARRPWDHDVESVTVPTLMSDHRYQGRQVSFNLGPFVDLGDMRTTSQGLEVADFHRCCRMRYANARLESSRQ